MPFAWPLGSVVTGDTLNVLVCYQDLGTACYLDGDPHNAYGSYGQLHIAKRASV